PSGIGGPSGPNVTFLVEGQLFAQEEILSSQGGSGLKDAAQESDEVQTDAVKGQRGMPKGVVAWDQSPTPTPKTQPLVELRKYLRRTTRADAGSSPKERQMEFLIGTRRMRAVNSCSERQCGIIFCQIGKEEEGHVTCRGIRANQPD